MRLSTKGLNVLNVTVESARGVVSVRCEGRLVRGQETILLCAVIQLHGRHINLDLSGVDTIDAAGIGALVSLQAAGKYLRLVAPSLAVRQKLRLISLDSVFEISESECGGSHSVQPSRVLGMLRLNLESAGKSTIVFCHGRLVWSEEGTFLKEIFFMRNCDRLTLDLAGVYSIDARGLGALATIARWALREGVKLLVSNPTRRVDRLIRLVKLNTVIPMRAVEHVPAELGIAK